MDFIGTNRRPEANALRLARFCSHETSLLHCVQYFLRGFTIPKKSPQRSQYLISIFIRFTCLFGFPVVPFKALVQHFFHPQHLVGFVPGHARCHRQLQPPLTARRFVKARHQHSPAFLTMNAGTSLPVARHRQTHLAIQIFQRAGLIMQISSFDTPFSASTQTMIEWRP